MDKNELKNINQLNSIELKLRENPVYAKMLNNLLGIGTHDNAVCASSRYDNIDLFDVLGEEDLRRIFSSSAFEVRIKNTKFENGILSLTEAADYETFSTEARNFQINLLADERKIMRENFVEGKALTMKRLKKGDHNFVAGWKKYRNKYLDRQAQMNSWPLHLGTMFIEVKTEKASIYAPLLLKKVQIEIDKDQITLQSFDDSIILNQKLIYLLGEEMNMHLKAPSDDEPVSFEQFINANKERISTVVTGDFNPITKFEIRPKSRIENPVPSLHGGMALMIVSPDGGHLRNQVLKMIENSSIYHLLQTKADHTLIPQIRDMIIKQKGFYRITPTDISQEEAIFGAFKDHAIIWGPPGTGKSQTIANIMANLMLSNKKVIVTSEKKAALDVLVARLGKLSKYFLFGLTDKTTSKENFYLQFKKLLKAASEATPEPILNQKPVPFMPKEVKIFFDHRNSLVGENLDQLGTFYAETKNLNWRSIPHYSKLFLATNKHKELADAIVQYKNFYTALNKTEVEMRGVVFKRLPAEIKRVGQCYLVFNKNGAVLKSIAHINDLGQINKINKHIEAVKGFKNIKDEFIDDSDLIDKYLASVFKGRIDKLLHSKDEKIATLTQSFIDAIERAHQIPFKFLAKYKVIIDKLFNVFVSTPNTLASLINFRETFDYAIFDEASQLHIEKAVPFMGIAKKVIIAGDDKQMRPSNFFGVRDDEDEDEEEGFSSNDSLLDFARHKGLDRRTYMLTKNYRSNSSELMLFSSKNFYESRLDVIDSRAYLGSQAIEVFDVPGKWFESTNEVEAKMVLKTTLKHLTKHEKIIILTFNTMQKNFMEDMIYDNDEYEPIQDAILEEKVLLRNLENIQGDEADLVIISVAYDKTAHLNMTYVARSEGQNALNVAISRAKNKMIVFKSIKASEVRDNDKNASIKVFKDWLTYLESSKTSRIQSTSVISKIDNSHKKVWVEDVKNYLQNNFLSLNNSTIKTNVTIGSYQIDIAIYKQDRQDELLLGLSLISYKKTVDEAEMIGELEAQHFMRSKGYDIFQITEFGWNFSKNKIANEIIKKIDKAAGK